MYPSMYNQPQQQQFQQQQYCEQAMFTAKTPSSFRFSDAPPPSMYPQLAQPGPEAYGVLSIV